MKIQQMVDEENISKNENIKMHILKTAESTSIHGIPSLIRSFHPSHRIMWAIVCLISLALCTLYIRLQVLRYYEYPKGSTNKLIYEDEVEFPNVAFCNINPITTEVSVQFLLDYIKNTTKMSPKTDNKFNLTDAEFAADIFKVNYFLINIIYKLNKSAF